MKSHRQYRRTTPVNPRWRNWSISGAGLSWSISRLRRSVRIGGFLWNGFGICQDNWCPSPDAFGCRENFRFVGGDFCGCDIFCAWDISMGLAVTSSCMALSLESKWRNEFECKIWSRRGNVRQISGRLDSSRHYQ